MKEFLKKITKAKALSQKIKVNYMEHNKFSFSIPFYYSYSCEFASLKETTSKQEAHILIFSLICINWAI